MLTPAAMKAHANANVLSPSGKYHAFDKSVDGCVRGEGHASIVLECVNESIDNTEIGTNSDLMYSSCIHAIVSSVKVACDRSSTSFTALNLEAQSNLLCETLLN